MSSCEQHQAGLCVGQGWKGSMSDKRPLKWIVPLSLVLVFSCQLVFSCTVGCSTYSSAWSYKRAVPAITKQNIVPTKRWSSPSPLFWDYLTWILPPRYVRVNGDDPQWWSSVVFGPSSGKVGRLSVVGLWVGWQGEWLLPWDFQDSFGTLVVQETGLPSQLLCLPIYATVYCSPCQCPGGESELSCFTSLLSLQESAS